MDINGIKGIDISQGLTFLVNLGPIYSLKGYFISQKVQKATMAYADALGLSRMDDNEADAYRHFVWTIENIHAFGRNLANKMEKIHEQYSVGGYGVSAGSRMDLWNNGVARSIQYLFPFCSGESIWYLAKDLGVAVLSATDPRLDNMNFSTWELDAPVLEVTGLIDPRIVDFLWEAYLSGWTAEEARQEYQRRKGE